MKEKTTFALFYGNRGFFPASLIEQARSDLPRVLKDMGHEVLMLDKDATRYGAVETPREGEIYAEFLEKNRGKFGGVILCLPNFGDENGAVAALKKADVPIFVQAYPDELDKMSPALRRDSFCGKLSIMDVFNQVGMKFTVCKPHVVDPTRDRFRENIEYFDRVCRVVNGARGMTVGEVGARTTPFKTVRIDEITLQRHDITVETFDLSGIFESMRSISDGDASLKSKIETLKKISSWQDAPAAALQNLARLGLVLDRLVEEYNMSALSLRCWSELQEQMHISPCVVNGEMMARGIPVACEIDTGSAVAMHLLGCASGRPTAILDWNNNYGADEDKCILFHCGNAASSLMTSKGRISDHEILKNAIGPGKSFGCNVGRLSAGSFTFGGLLTDSGRVKVYLGDGEFTTDKVPDDFFGVAGVAQVRGLQDVLMFIGERGYRHHVVLTPAVVRKPVEEALVKYLGFDVSVPQGCCA